MIKIDERLRDALTLDKGQTYDFDIEPASLFGQFRWAWAASEPAYRVAARMAALSLILGVVGLVLGVVSLCLSLT